MNYRDTKIHSWQPATGDWFLVEYHENDKRVFIERVLHWAYVSGHRDDVSGHRDDVSGHPDHVLDHIEGIPESGYYDPVMSDEQIQRFFVAGGDNSPIGATWNDLYHAAPVEKYPPREITDPRFFPEDEPDSD